MVKTVGAAVTRMNTITLRVALAALCIFVLLLAHHLATVTPNTDQPAESVWNVTVSLLMVKNEGAIIDRCIEALQAHVGQHVFVCDTGSTDDTLERAAEHSNVYIHQLEEGFTHFEQARNGCKDALQRELASMEWIALPDADMIAMSEVETPQPPAYDVNTIQIRGVPHNALHLLVRANIFFNLCRYRLWTHEYLDCGPADASRVSYGFYNGFYFEDAADGVSRVHKTRRDIALLTEWMHKVNETELRPRALYYLARAYEDNNQTSLARRTYWRHQQVQTHTNYLFYAQYRMAHLALAEWQHNCDANASVCAIGIVAVTEGFWAAFTTYDGYFRREPFYHLAVMHRRLGHYHECLMYTAAALQLPPVDQQRIPLFLELEAYGSGVQAEYDFCLSHIKIH